MEQNDDFLPNRENISSRARDSNFQSPVLFHCEMEASFPNQANKADPSSFFFAPICSPNQHFVTGFIDTGDVQINLQN